MPKMEFFQIFGYFGVSHEKIGQPADPAGHTKRCGKIFGTTFIIIIFENNAYISEIKSNKDVARIGDFEPIPVFNNVLPLKDGALF